MTQTDSVPPLPRRTDVDQRFVDPFQVHLPDPWDEVHQLLRLAAKQARN